MVKKLFKIVSVVSIVSTTSPISAQKTVFWSVRDTVGGHSSYLLGTFHPLGNGFADSLTVVMDALIHADLGVFESLADPTGTLARINARQPSDEIANLVSKRDYRHLTEFESDWNVDIDKLRPAELNVKLHQVYSRRVCGGVRPIDRHRHFDNYLMFVRDSLGLENFGLETDSLQMTYIQRQYGQSLRTLRKDTHRTLKRLRKKKVDRRECGQLWAYQRMNIGDYHPERPCGENVIITERNREWMEVLPDLLRTRSCFVAVGLFHLFNRCGLVGSLRRAGFVVEPIYDLSAKEPVGGS